MYGGEDKPEERFLRLFYLVFRFYREGAKANYRVTFGVMIESEEKIPNVISIKIAKKMDYSLSLSYTNMWDSFDEKGKVFGLSVIESKGEMNARGKERMSSDV